MYHFIVNPNAGSGKGKYLWKQVEEILTKEDMEYVVHIPESGSEVTRLVRQMTGEMQEDVHIIVVGGDGTLNDVLQGIVDFSHTKLSCIRVGSGNDFARNMGISKNMRKTIRHILYEPEEILLDYGVAEYANGGQLESRRFIISSGIGYDADICQEVSVSSLKRMLNRIHLGKLIYLIIGVKQIFSRISPKAVIQLDDAPEMTVSQMFFTVGMIHEKEGGGVPFCPHADARDGLLEVCLVRSMSKCKLMLAVMLVYMRKHLLFQNITEHRCKRLYIRAEQPQWFHLDGDTPCQIEELVLTCQSGIRFIK